MWHRIATSLFAAPGATASSAAAIDLRKTHALAAQLEAEVVDPREVDEVREHPAQRLGLPEDRLEGRRTCRVAPVRVEEHLGPPDDPVSGVRTSCERFARKSSLRRLLRWSSSMRRALRSAIAHCSARSVSVAPSSRVKPPGRYDMTSRTPRRWSPTRIGTAMSDADVGVRDGGARPRAGLERVAFGELVEAVHVREDRTVLAERPPGAPKARRRAGARSRRRGAS